MGLGTPLQRIAMGLVVVVVDAGVPARPVPAWRHYDALPNPLGWLLVLSGLLALVRLEAAFRPALGLAALAAVISVPTWFPQLTHALDASAQWSLSLPQLLACLLLARTIGRLGAEQTPRDAYAAHRFGLVVWGFAVAAVLPVVVLGGGVDRLGAATQLVSLVVNVGFVYLLFRVHRRPWLGGAVALQGSPDNR